MAVHEPVNLYLKEGRKKEKSLKPSDELIIIRDTLPIQKR